MCCISGRYFITCLCLVAILQPLHVNSHRKVSWNRGSAQESVESKSGTAKTGVSLSPEKQKP